MRPGVLARKAPASRVAISLLGVLVLAKALVLIRAGIGFHAVSEFAYFWQDIAVALAFGVFALSPKMRTGLNFLEMSPGLVLVWTVYTLLVTYVAINVPITGVLGSPLTWPLIRAARGPLADSIVMYLTPQTAAAALTVLIAGTMLPIALRRVQRISTWAIAAAFAMMLAGAVTAPRLDTRGFDRNALTALAMWPRVSAAAASATKWRDSAFEASPPRLGALAGTARGMNVLMVILESTGAQYLGVYGAAADPMPTLSRISRSSLVFDAAYAVYPESIKGLYAAMCARSPRFGATMEALLAKPDGPCESPARALARAGYATSLFHSGRFGYLGMDALVASLGFDHLADAGAIGGHVQSSFGVDEASTVASMLAWIDTTDTRGTAPFFTVYMPAAGHHPYATNVPGPFTGDDDLSRYRNALHETDAALSTLLAGLESRGRLAQTMLIIFGDHGEAFGQHAGNIGHTLFIHDENVRVPYLISIPGVTNAETRVLSPASVLDTAPTLFDLMGITPPAGVEGRSLLAPGARIAPFFADYSLGWLGLRDGCWKYQFNVNALQSHLFNVCEDPAETINRAEEQPARVTSYRKTLTNWK